MLDYAALSALAAVVREGSFERAARVLSVTPSAISQRIRTLEERIGCALVERGQPCIATDTGRRLCLHVDQVRLLEQELQKAMPGISPDGVSRVAIPVAVNADSFATWFAPSVAAYASNADVLMEVVVDDEGYTAEWLRKGKVLAAVTASAQPAAGCNSLALGAMRYVAAASPDFCRRYFADGVRAGSLANAPSLVFDNKDSLQAQWVRRQCRRHVELPRHVFPSTEAFVTAAKSGMGWGLQPEQLIAPLLKDGTLVTLVDNSPLDVPLYWQQARASSSLLVGLTGSILEGARAALIQN